MKTYVLLLLIVGIVLILFAFVMHNIKKANLNRNLIQKKKQKDDLLNTLQTDRWLRVYLVCNKPPTSDIEILMANNTYAKLVSNTPLTIDIYALDSNANTVCHNLYSVDFFIDNQISLRV